jgi:predicted small lipoprotein YifL
MHIRKVEKYSDLLQAPLDESKISCRRSSRRAVHLHHNEVEEFRPRPFVALSAMMSPILESTVPQTNRSLLRYAACRFAVFGVLAAALALGACGRKGPLDPPPLNAVEQPAAQWQAGGGETPGQSAAQVIEYGPDGQPLAPRGPKKKLRADWLID